MSLDAGVIRRSDLRTSVVIWPFLFVQGQKMQFKSGKINNDKVNGQNSKV